MGSSQSSHAKGIKRSSLKKNALPLGLRGRKSMISKTFSAPHDLMASVVSFPSEHLRELQHANSEELDATSALSCHSDDVNLHLEYEQSVEGSDDSESDSDDEELVDELWEDRIRVLDDARLLKQAATYFLHPEHPVPSSVGVRCFFDRISTPPIDENEESSEKEKILADAAVLKKIAVMFLHPEAPIVADDATRLGRNYYSRPDAYYDDKSGERLSILKDARELKEASSFFLHPETSVPSSTGARCFFDRASAPDVVSADEADENHAILADAALLKLVATMYQHPEYAIAADDGARFGRNYFSRPAAFDLAVDEVSTWEEHLLILEDTRNLKELASYFLHPEAPVTSSTGARCFFDRMSAPLVISEEEAYEKEAFLADTAALKIVADMYLHPEAIVASSFGARCYFDRFSTPDVLSPEDAVEANSVLADAAALKEAASMYLHPEAPFHSTVGARCYYDRISASVVASDDEIDEAKAILADASDLKEIATMFLHPEKAVASSAGARCYFDRVSAPAVVSDEESDAINVILTDASALKEVATMYLHPEAPVSSVAGARCFYSRFSATPYVAIEEAEERLNILVDASTLKRVASMYHHPESAVVVKDQTIFGRNYFSRPSALHVVHKMEDDALFEERLLVLEEARQLKQLASYFLHPEVPLASSNGSRCFFDRISAPGVISIEESDDKGALLVDAAALKYYAKMFHHPETSMVTEDPTSFGRNYFLRPSACEVTVDEEERAVILSELKALKKAATHFLHPELPVEMAEPTAFGRNYFTRFSAPETESPEQEGFRVTVLEDAALLKMSASVYAHPEFHVVTTDAFACGRNFFNRFSSTETESIEDMGVRDQVLADSFSLKKHVMDFMHPERPVVGNGSCTRNYFDRPSSTSHHQMIHTFPAHEDDWGDDHHEHVDHFGMDEEMELFSDLRERLNAPIEQNPFKMHAADSDVGSNLSRSPSSVMLFGMDDSNYYD